MSRCLAMDLWDTICIMECKYKFVLCSVYSADCIQQVGAHVYTGCPRMKVNILGDHGVGHSKHKIVYIHASYSERFSRKSYFTVQQFGFGTQYCPSLQHVNLCEVSVGRCDC
jgi:hypothetical protein